MKWIAFGLAVAVPMAMRADAATALKPAPVTSLAGEWRVAGLDGQPVEGATGLALRGSKTRIWWEPRCAGFVRHYRMRGSRISITGYRKGEAPQVICLIAPPAEIARAFTALDAAKRVRRTANNGIELSGGGYSLLLFSQ
jgi:hypothetical protein